MSASTSFLYTTRTLRFSALLMATVAAVNFMGDGAAQAQWWGEEERPRVRQQRHRESRESRRDTRPVRETSSTRREPALKREAAAKPAPALGPPEPLVAIVSLPSQHVQVHGAHGVIAESKVSTGQSGHRTPTGVFSILQRNRYHESNIYSGAPMPFMQRLTWSGIAMHEGVVPGYPASHGCIRLPGGFATRLWGMGRIGMRVLVTPTDTPLHSIEHARLPVPVMTPVAANDIPQPVQTAAAGNEEAPRLLDPFKLAHARKIKAAAEQAATEKAVRPAFDQAKEKSAEAQAAAEALRRAEAAVTDAEDTVLEKSAAMARVQTETSEAELARELAAAQERLETVRGQVAALRSVEVSRSDEAFAAARAAREAEEAVAQASTAARLASAGMETVSIFVSRKEGRVFVRQGFTPIHEEAIEIAEPDRPLGTHVYTAIEAKDGGAALRWVVATVQSSPPEAKSEDGNGRKRGARTQASEPRGHLPQSTAQTALDRFELPEATRKLVADRLWPGASLIVSDFGISGETGKGTDFVVLTK